jgi:O-antigen/teichoic acid export membrane protein
MVKRLKNLVAKVIPAAYSPLVKDTAVYGMAKGSSKLFGLLLTPILTRIFSPTDYGVIDIISTTAAMFVMFLSLNLESAIARYFYEIRTEEERATLLSTVMFSIMGLVFAIGALTVSLAGTIGNWLFHSSEYDALLIISLVTVPFQMLSGILLLVFRLMRKSTTFWLLTIFQIIVQFVLTLVLVLGERVGIVGVFWANLGSFLLQVIVSLYFQRRFYRLAFSVPYFRRAARFALPGFPAVFVGWLVTALPRYFLLMYAGLAEVGLFAVATKVSSFLMIFIGAFQMGWVPFYMERLNDEGSNKVFAKIQNYFLLLLSAVSLLFIIFSKPIVILFAGHNYSGAENVLGLLFIATCVQYGIGMFWSVGVTKAERTIHLSVAQLIAAAALIMSSIVLVPKYHADGAVIAMIIAYSVQATYLLGSSARFYDNRFSAKRSCAMIGYLVMCAILSRTFLSASNSIPVLLIFTIVTFPVLALIGIPMREINRVIETLRLKLKMSEEG